MNKISITFLIFLSLLLEVKAQEKLPINVEKSSINWIGEYTFYFGGHEGTVNFEEGYFIKSEDKITGGSFTIDMTTLASTDIESKEGRTNLDNHLKDPDFFNVQKFPKAYLTITNVEYIKANKVKMTADFTIKEITEPIKFIADIDFENEVLHTKFKIDRTRWGINYNSTMRDGAISDAIGFKVSVHL